MLCVLQVFANSTKMASTANDQSSVEPCINVLNDNNLLDSFHWARLNNSHNILSAVEVLLQLSCIQVQHMYKYEVCICTEPKRVNVFKLE